METKVKSIKIGRNAKSGKFMKVTDAQAASETAVVETIRKWKPTAKVEYVRYLKKNKFIAIIQGEEHSFEISTPKFRLNGQIWTAQEAAQNRTAAVTMVEMRAGNLKCITNE